MAGQLFFTSDHHFGHTNIIGFCNRPFACTSAMNEAMVRRWNERVTPEDMVYHLGDFSLSHQLAERFSHRLNGAKHLIMGNHDACHPCRKSAAQARKLYYRAGFQSLELQQSMTIAGQTVLLNHMPYREESPEGYVPKYLEYRPRDQGGWLLHGHVHEKWKLKNRMLNVGVDVWDFYPVPLEEIARIIAAAVEAA